MNDLIVTNEEEMKVLLDEFMNSRSSQWWDQFYTDKERTIPFFVDVPDENLVQYVESGALQNGAALDIGCGNGRNSLYLAQRGFHVTAIDFSSESIDYAKTHHAHPDIDYRQVSFFDYAREDAPFDLIYESGCLHHISPHRRPEYLGKIRSLLREGGTYAMVNFNEKGGADLTDYQVYTEGSMRGGLAFSEAKLRRILSPYFQIREIREMREITDGSAYGTPICWAAVMEK